MLSLTIVLVVLFLSACSGGGNSEDDINTIQTYTLSGQIQIATNTQTDTDNNDVNNSLIENNTYNQAQDVNNIVRINGFVTATATNSNNDRFQFSADTIDYYKVSLNENQVVRLKVIDFETTADIIPTPINDIDLYIRDAIDPNTIISFSNADDKDFEQIEITTPGGGEFIVEVVATTGQSKYVLDFIDFFDIANYAHGQNIKFADVIPNEAIVEYKNNNQLANQFKSINYNQNRTNLIQFYNSVFINTQIKSHPLIIANQNVDNETYSKLSTIQYVKNLKQESSVEFASLNMMRKPSLVPNDTFYNLQWHYRNMNLPLAWDFTTGSSSPNPVVVAVIDTGVFMAHPDLAPNLTTDGYDFISVTSISNDGDGIDSNPDDPGDAVLDEENSWHGTHVSGTIASATNNLSGVAGVSWDAKVMPLRALGQGGGTSYDIEQAVRYAAGLPNDSGTVPMQTADIINMSLGGTGSSAAEAALFSDIFDLGIPVVAAAGNSSTNTPSFPAAYKDVFSVAALDLNNQQAYYSNFGSTIDIAAPGGDMGFDLNGDAYNDGILSTFVDNSSGTREPGYAFLQGTSMAAPHVAGMFALMKAAAPSITASDIQMQLQSGLLTEEAGLTGRDDVFGYGIADANKAVKEAFNFESNPSSYVFPPSMRLTPNYLDMKNALTATVSLENQGDGSPGVDQVIASDSWINVTYLDAAADQLGDYEIAINNVGLADGIYLGTVRFTFQTGMGFDYADDVILYISMQKGNISFDGVASEIYVLLFNTDTSEVIDEDRVNINNLNYSFEEVPEGSYLIYAGTDIDNDLFVCTSGETCGAFPNLNEIEPININENLSNINFLINIQSNLSTVASLSENNQTESILFERLINENSDSLEFNRRK